MSRKVSIKQNKQNQDVYDVQFNGLTRGEILAMYSALTHHNTPVAKDVLAYLRNALGFSNDPLIRELDQ